MCTISEETVIKLLKNVLNGEREMNLCKSAETALDGGIDLVDFSTYFSCVKEDPLKTKIYFDAFNAGVSLSEYEMQLYSGEQLRWIFEGKKEGLDVSIYDSPKMPHEAMNTAYVVLHNEAFDKKK